MHGAIIIRDECKILNPLKNLLQVEDDYPILNIIWYSLDRKKRDGSQTMACLDRIYIVKTLKVNIFSANYKISSNNSFLDYLSI